jgi:hypothetical protein
MSYFDRPEASNSDIKKLVARVEGREELKNIQALYDFGTGFHCGITEPHKISGDLSPADVELIGKMSKRFWRDELCRNLVMMPDFRREHEFYRRNRFGLDGSRCKVDGDSRKLKTILELKGLAVTTHNGFMDSLMHLDYDQGIAWYLDNASGYVKYERVLIVAISKKDPELLFKLLVDRSHPMYRSGTDKIKKGIKIWKQHGYK